MLQRNLLYSAVTTGKKKVNFVGELKAVQSGIRSIRRFF
jgi:ATP-dependent exoDNAse (exonuclease V) alpha subunit